MLKKMLSDCLSPVTAFLSQTITGVVYIVKSGIAGIDHILTAPDVTIALPCIGLSILIVGMSVATNYSTRILAILNTIAMIVFGVILTFYSQASGTMFLLSLGSVVVGALAILRNWYAGTDVSKSQYILSFFMAPFISCLILFSRENPDKMG